MMISERRLPIFPLNTVLFPSGTIPLQIFEDRYKMMLDECLDSDSKFGVTLIKEGSEVGGPAVPYDIGTVALIEQVEEIEGDRYFVTAVGQERFQIIDVAQWTPFIIAEVELLSDEGEPASDDLIAEATDAFSDYARLAVGASGGWVRRTRVPSDPSALSYHIANALQMRPADKQILLEADSAAERLSVEVDTMRRGYDKLRRRMAWELTNRFSRH